MNARLIDHLRDNAGDAPDLLEAVGYDREHSEYFDTAIRCSVCKETTDGPVGKVSRCYAYKGHSQGGQESIALAPTYDYTGPGLGTPELDAILLVAGQRWCVENWHKYDDVNDALYDGNLQAINETDTFALEWLLFYCDTPGHALARAIREVNHA